MATTLRGEPIHSSKQKRKTMLLEHISEMKRLYRKTDNPVWVWMALQSLLDEKKAELKVPLPDWCMQYIADCASNIIAASLGCDFRLMTSDQKASYDYDHVGPRMTLDEAMALIPAALKLSRQGWNAFTATDREIAKLSDRAAAERLREKGMKSKDIVQALGQKWGLDDERTVRRRIAEARRLWDSEEGES